MRARLTGAAAAAALAVLAALAPPATAQEPSPTPAASPSPTSTPSPTPTPTPEESERAERDERDRKSKSVRSIYRDFERDGRIDDCDHTKKALRKARRSIADTYEQDYPDFSAALKAAIERHDEGKCEEQQAERDEEATGGAGGGTTTPPAPPPPIAPPPPVAPATPPPPATSPDSGALPDFGGGGGGGFDSDTEDGSLGEIPPAPGEEAIPEGTPSPEAAPAPPAAAPLPPKLVVTRATADPNLFVPGTMLALALIGLLLAGLSALAAKKTGRLAGVGHAWQEAAWRTSGTWSDFTDWVRAGR